MSASFIMLSMMFQRTANQQLLRRSVILILLLFVHAKAKAATEVLDWDFSGHSKITYLYGTITPLATTSPTYFCGAEWRGVEGYSGIQDLSAQKRVTIFSVWDTSPQLHPRVTNAAPEVHFSRFANEGSGAHTDLPINWKVGETFQFFLQKLPGSDDTTETRFYIVNPESNMWQHVSTITSPNGGDQTGQTFHDVVSWIENIEGLADATTPKVVLYSLWAGTSFETMKRLVRTGGRSGSGRWGQLGDSYFAAEGSPEKLATFFASVQQKYGEPTFGVDGQELSSIKDKPLSPEIVRDLESLPRAPSVEN